MNIRNLFRRGQTPPESQENATATQQVDVNSLAQELSEQHENIVQQTNNPTTWLGGAETFSTIQLLAERQEQLNTATTATERAYQRGVEPLLQGIRERLENYPPFPLDEPVEVIEPPPGQGWREGGWAAGPFTAAPPPPYTTEQPFATAGNTLANQARLRWTNIEAADIRWTGENGAMPPQQHRRYAGTDLTQPTPTPGAAPETGCIPFDHPALQHIRSIVPAAIHEMMWVAGSACCTYPLNGDVDAWLGWLERDASTAERRLQIQVSQASGNTRDALPESEIYPGQQSVLLYAGVAPDGTRIHILGALAPMLDVINNFDISCHAMGVRLSDGFTRAHPMFTRTYCVNILSWTNARKTLTRGIKFAERYGDTSFWRYTSTQRCAAEAFDMPYMTAEMAERVHALSVSEGL